MVSNGTMYISHRKRFKLPSIKYHKNERRILPHKITWWRTVCKEITNKVNSSAEGLEYDTLTYFICTFKSMSAIQPLSYHSKTLQYEFFLAVSCNLRGKTQEKSKTCIRKELNIRCAAKHFWRPSTCLKVCSNTVFSVWYISSIDTKTKMKTYNSLLVEDHSLRATGSLASLVEYCTSIAEAMFFFLKTLRVLFFYQALILLPLKLPT